MDQTYLQWLTETNAKDPENMCDAPLPYNMAVGFLIDELLGSDWYVSLPENGEQVANAAVFSILTRYSKSFRKELFEHKCIILFTHKLTVRMRLHLFFHPVLRYRRQEYWKNLH